MFAIVFALGVLMGPQELSETVATAGEVPAVAPSSSIALSDGAGQGGFSRSDQVISAAVNAVTVTVGGGESEIRTGDILITANGVGSGLQAVNLNTGLGSISQASVSIAAGAGGVVFSAQPK